MTPRPDPKPKRGKRPATRTRLDVSFDEFPDFDGSVTAYAFDARGTLLASAPVETGKVTLPLNAKQLTRTRLIFAPTPEGSQVQPTPRMLERLDAYEPALTLDADGGLGAVRVPGGLLEKWLFCRCRVRGKVVRPVATNGSTEDRPVCRARVHICEVDKIPRLVAKLPDDRLLRLRDDLLDLIGPRPPWKKLPELVRAPTPGPIPWPDPYSAKAATFRADPFVVDPTPEALAKMQSYPQFEAAQDVSSPLSTVRARFINPQPEPPGGLVPRLGPQPEPPDRSMLDTMFGPSISAGVRIGLESSSTTLVRDTLLAHPELVRVALCLWPWWWIYECDELQVVDTDHFGRFETTFWYLCSGDAPDLYFWVEYFIDGAWQTVYRPPIACATRWDFNCGDLVTLRITDARVPACSGPPDLVGCQVAVMSIGNRVSISEIQDDSVALADEGLTDGKPFGGRLEPHVWFSRSALFAKGITHYRWSYRRLTGPDGTTPQVSGWSVMDRRVGRHYSVVDPVSGDLSFPFEQLGPDPSVPAPNLFRIQPIDPPTPGIDWEVRDAREDTASGFFLTHQLNGGNAPVAAGKYEIKLELFKIVGGAAVRVDWDAEGVDLKVSDQPAPIGQNTDTTVDATNYHRLRDAAAHTVGFKLRLRVDNNACYAHVYSVAGPGLIVDPNCGYIEYTPGATATLSFQAMHPNDFGRLNFDIRRGLSVDVPEASVHGPLKLMTIDSDAGAPDGPFTRDALGVYSKAIPVATLLSSNTAPGGSVCDRAAFAQTLYVHAIATDGWSDELDYLDSGLKSAAFALDLPCPPCA